MNPADWNLRTLAVALIGYLVPKPRARPKQPVQLHPEHTAMKHPNAIPTELAEAYTKRADHEAEVALAQTRIRCIAVTVMVVAVSAAAAIVATVGLPR